MNNTTNKRIQIPVTIETGFFETDNEEKNAERIVIASAHKILTLTEISLGTVELEDEKFASVLEMIQGFARAIAEHLPHYPGGEVK